MPHRRMVAHWIDFTRRHRETLLRSDFRPHHYESNYPWIEAESAAERIVGVYAPDTAVPFPGAGKAQFVLNGTGTGRLIVEVATPAVAEVRDTFGNFVGSVPLVTGLNDVRVPVSGCLAIREPGDGASGLQDTGTIKKERYLVPGQNARSLLGKGERISASLSTTASFCSG